MDSVTQKVMQSPLVNTGAGATVTVGATATVGATVNVGATATVDTTIIASTDNVRSITSINQIPREGNVVIDFYATWCGPCKKLGPLFSKLSNEYLTVSFLKVDSDEAEDLCKHYEVSALPTVLFIKNGEVVSIIKGFNENKIISELQELIE
jgi:thioredoxin